MEKHTGRTMLNLIWTWRGITGSMSLYGSLLCGFINRQVDILQIGITENTSCSSCCSSCWDFLLFVGFFVFVLFFLALIIVKLKISFYREAGHKAIDLSNITWMFSCWNFSEPLSSLLKAILSVSLAPHPTVCKVAEVTKYFSISTFI